MTITQWPLARRSDVVRAFRPDSDGSGEAPFRTLRNGALSTAGVRVMPRRDGRIAGRLSAFSTLNVDAARWARWGRRDVAEALAQAAARLESGPLFRGVASRLTDLDSDVVQSALDGSLPPSDRRTWSMLVELAESTEEARDTVRMPDPVGEILRGVVERADDETVTVSGGDRRALLPKWLAERVHRDVVGQWIVVLTERAGDAAALVNVFPGIRVHDGDVPCSVEATSPPVADGVVVERRFDPFSREDVAGLSLGGDALAYLRAPRRPLDIMVPVVINR